MAGKRRPIVSDRMPGWALPGHALRRRAWSRRLPLVLVTAAILGGTALVAARLDPLPPRFTGEGRASDGDSFRLGSDRVRLLGIDAPELDQVCWRDDGGEWPCGRDARGAMADLLAEGPVECRTTGADRFGRFLATCTTAGGEDLGGAIVSAGLAVSREGYGAEESAAREAGRGLWSGRFTDPRTWRDEGPSDDPGPGLFEELWTWLRELTGARTLR